MSYICPTGGRNWCAVCCLCVLLEYIISDIYKNCTGCILTTVNQCGQKPVSIYCVHHRLKNVVYLQASVSDNAQLQINLLLELIRYKDLPAAAYWAQYFNIDSRNIPFQLQDYMKQHPTLTKCVCVCVWACVHVCTGYWVGNMTCSMGACKHVSS